jgi:ligand-binding sensor domain-containing protein
MYKIALLVLLAIANTSLFSQEYRFTVYNTENSPLPQNQISSLFQDSRGNIWIGTKFGAARFDGENFKVFSPHNGVLQGDITEILETTNGRIVLCSNTSGLSIVSGDSVETYPKPAGYVHISAVWFKEKILLAASTPREDTKKSALFEFEQGKYKKIHEYPFSQFSLIASKDTLWAHFWYTIGTTSRLGYLDKSFNFIELITTYRFNYIRNNNNTLYFYNKNENTVYSSGKFVKMDIPPIYTFHSVTKGGLYFRADNSILYEYHFNGQMLDSFLIKDAGPVLTDKENNTWIGSENGLYKLSERAFRHYVFSDYGIKASNPGAIADKGAIWLSSHLGQLYKFENNRFQDYSQQLPVRNPAFLISRAVQSDGTIIWGGTMEGVIRKQGNRFYYDKTFKSGAIYGIYHDKERKQTVYGFWQGIRVKNQKGETLFTKDSIPGLRVVLAIEKDHEGNYICATRGGIYRLKGENLEPIAHPLFDYGALDIAHDKKQNLWFGGEGGLIFGNKQTYRKIEHHSFINKAITALHVVGDSVLLIGTTSGMAALCLKEFYANGRLMVKFYNAQNGFSGYECSQDGFTEDEKGFVWIPLNDRLIRIDPRRLVFNNVSVEPYISSVSVMYGAHWETWDTTGHTFSHREDKIRFRFSGPYFSNPVSYSSFLEGYDREWSPYGNTKEAIYTNLPPGQYVFHVRANNGDESVHMQTSYVFRVRPAWWETLAARLSLLLILIASGIAIFRKILKDKVKAQRKRYEQNKLMMQAQLAQLDPHFIFNTLTTTGTFALRLQQVGIYDIIVRFSHLLRTHWANNKLTRKLSEELDFVREYCGLNRINHNERFDFSIEIAKGVDTSIKVLKLFVQNFVENAMKHGIENIKEHGMIRIQVSQDDGYTRIKIDDNGIGYRAGLKTDTGRARTGLKTLAETVRLYNSWNKDKLVFDILDKSDKGIGEQGTIVFISIPNNYNYGEG